MKRRPFIRIAASAAAAATGVVSADALAQAAPSTAAPSPAAPPAPAGRAGGAGAPQQAAIPLGNGEHPALVFQAYPGGTGALIEKMVRERGIAAFERKPIEVAPWSGGVPTREEDLAFLPAERIGALIKERRISSMDITEIYLDRLKRYNEKLLFAVTILDGRAREEAQQADMDVRAGNWRGPLHGVPWGVKDLFSAKGGPTTWGSADFQSQVIDEDAELIVRLRNAGAVLLAKLSTGQFAAGANWFRGQTKNPWNPAASSSGSSAGPGSATAAGAVGFSIGTETQGSIVGPTSTCGINALRPTFGRISRAGGMVLSWSMDKPGPMCRSILDCALVFNAVHGADPKDPATVTTPFQFDPRAVDFARLRIGYVGNTPEAFLEQLRALGADPKPMPALPPASSMSLNVDEAAAFDFYVGERARAQEAAGERSNARFFVDRWRTALEYVQSQRRRLVQMRQWQEITKDWDVWIGGGGSTNQTGHPVAVFPYTFAAGTGNNGPTPAQPRTVQMFADVFNDDLLLSVAHAYQVEHDWHTRRPNLDG